jgi:hypothetical protein
MPVRAMQPHGTRDSAGFIHHGATAGTHAFPPPALLPHNVSAFIRLLPMSERAKDIEILAMRHQLAILQQQIEPRVTLADREFLAALLHRLPSPRLRRLRRIVSLDTILAPAPRPPTPKAREHPAARAPADRPSDPPTLPRLRSPPCGRSPRRPSP